MIHVLHEPASGFLASKAIVLFHVTNVATVAMSFSCSLQEDLLDSHLSGLLLC